MRTVIVMVLVLAASTSHAQGTAPSVCVPDRQPATLDFTLKDIRNADVSLTAFRGKVVLLNFWATWCIPCKIEIPAFNELERQYRGSGVDIVGINVGEPQATVDAYSRTMKISYPNLLAGARTDIIKAFGVDVGLPTTIVISRDGTICRRRVGLTRKDTFERLIKALM